MSGIVAEPSVCPTCKGDRVILGHVGPLVLSEWPCPRCSCSICGRATDTPPECRKCFVEENARQERRADV